MEFGLVGTARDAIVSHAARARNATTWLAKMTLAGPRRVAYD
jgi:hypothetical protein